MTQGRRPRFGGRAPQWASAVGAVVWCLGGANGCAPEDRSGPREALCAGSGCSDECRNLEVELCDIRERGCQELVFQSVRCVRGSSLQALPRTSFVPQQQLGENTEPVDAGAATPEPNAAKIADDVWSQYLDEGLQLLRLVTAPLDEAKREEVKYTGGVASQGEVVVAENNVDYQWHSMRLLAHEYVHTMQEQDYGGLASLYYRYSRSSVTAQGIQAYIEGEAELYSWLAHAFMRNTSVESWALDEFFSTDDKRTRGHIAASGSPWTAARQWQHYAIGAKQLFNAWRLGHNVAVRSFLYNLQPDFGRWVTQFSPRVGPKVSETPICNPAGHELIVLDSLGPSGAFAILVTAFRAADDGVFPATRAWDLASALTEDQLRMFAPTLGVGQSQAFWLEKQASTGMCPLGEGKTGSATFQDGGAPSASSIDGPDAGETGETGDAACPDHAAWASDAGRFEPNEKTTFAELQQQLIPGAPVWVSWSLGFEETAAAREFADWVGAAGWETLRVERHGRQVILRGRRAAETEQERSAFEAWTCR